MLRFFASIVTPSATASTSKSTPSEATASASVVSTRDRSQSTPLLSNVSFTKISNKQDSYLLQLPKANDGERDENTVARVGEALRIRAATVSELNRDGEEVERILKRNYDAMKNVIEDIKRLRMEV